MPLYLYLAVVSEGGWMFYEKSMTNYVLALSFIGVSQSWNFHRTLAFLKESYELSEVKDLF